MSSLKKFIPIVFVFYWSVLNAMEFLVSSASEISAAMASAQPGDTLTMKTGVWTDQRIVFAGNGTAEKLILLRAEKPGRVVLTGTSTLRIGGMHLIVDGLYFKNGYSASGAIIEFRSAVESQNCRLTNTAIENYNPPNKDTDYKWVSLYGSHNRIDHCYLAGKKHSGTTLVVWLTDHPNYHLIDDNYFGERSELGYNGGETIRVGTSEWSMYDSYTIVEYNYFEHCDGETEIISSKSCENVYRYNTFYECQGTLTLRHGNRCTVAGNFFLGNGRSGTGGIRIIGENHKVYNNYLQDLTGTELRSPISIMNGVQNSPLNRYFQVIGAQVLFNTIVNCQRPVWIGAGADAELTLPPKDCVIANNCVSSSSTSPLVTIEAQPVNLTWLGNVMNGTLGIPAVEGITLADPLFYFAEDSLWRPAENSPVTDSAKGDYSWILDDFDGQSRSGLKDVGADERSDEQVNRRPLKPSDVGPAWFPVTEFVAKVSAGRNTLSTALNQTQSGDVIELTDDGGIYQNDASLEIGKSVTLRAAEGLTQRPVIQFTDAAERKNALLILKSAAVLQMTGVELDGESQAATIFLTDTVTTANHFKVKLDDCYLRNVSAQFYRAMPGSIADSLVFTNCLFTNSSEGFRLSDEAEGCGKYNVGFLGLTNCTFWKLACSAVNLYGGDDVPFTPCPMLVIEHCTFDSCGYSGTPIISAQEVDFVQIKNCILSNSLNSEPSVRLFGLPATILYSNLFNVGAVELNRQATIGAGMMSVDPEYADRENGEFTLAENSPMRGKGDDGQALGDLRWATGPVAVVPSKPANGAAAQFALTGNYPNPFNSQTCIGYRLSERGFTTIQILDVAGRFVETLASEWKMPGQYSLVWTPTNLASGIYFYQIICAGQTAARKMLYLK